MFYIFMIVFLIFYMCLPIFASSCLLIIAFMLKGKKTYWLLLLSVITFSILILLYIPSQDDDASRYFRIMDLLKPIYTMHDVLKLSQSNKFFQYQASSFGFTFFEVIFSKSTYYNLLPYVNTVICLFSIFYPFLDLKEKGVINGLEALYLSLPLFLVYNFLYTASTMRWALSCALFNLIVYLYFNKIKKRRYVWLFLVPILFHTGIVLGTCMAVFMVLVKNISLKKESILVLILILYLKLSTILNITGSSPASQIVGMTNTYSNDFMQHSLNGLIFLYIERIMLIVTCCTVLLVLHYEVRKREISRFEHLLLLAIAIQLALGLTPMIFDRYILVTLFLSLVSIAKHSFNSNPQIKRLILWSNLFVVLLGIVICYANVKRMPFVASIPYLTVSNIFYFIKNVPTY